MNERLRTLRLSSAAVLRTTGSSSYSRTAWFIRLPAAGFRLAERASAPTGAQDDRTTDSGAIGFPCAKTTAGPGARCGSGQATQRLGRQGHPGPSCGAWLHHRGEVRDAPVLLSRRTGGCLALRIARCRIQRLESDPRAFPTLKARRGPQNCRQLGPCPPPLQQDRLFDSRWAVTRERSRKNQKSSRGGRWELRRAAPSQRRRPRALAAGANSA